MELFRDGKLVNMPWALLVKGDTVLLKPGQISPARLVNMILWSDGVGTGSPL